MKKILIHGSHHKSGVNWFNCVLKKIAKDENLKYKMGDKIPIDGIDIIHEYHSFFNFNFLERIDYKGSHIIRDPRDVIISGYYYHKKSNEPWLHIARTCWGG